mmetsp:Transcript_11754/g.16311  ORF Transcript_11754/g.16311 Transcript_11754/m.16311 type:complete len:96 (-) Transcript_11754:117-404(-)
MHTRLFVQKAIRMASFPAQYTISEVANHNKRGDCWIIYRRKVYDVTNFLDEHPGGEEVLLDLAGKDATTDFDDVGHSGEATKIFMPKYYKGDIKE